MSGEIEGIGDVVTGAALARAAEASAGEGVAERDTRACLNCGAPLAAAFCGACGQKARVHRTLTEFAHDALHSVLHFDGKIWRTLPLLAWKPGDLTRRYVHGERAKFVSPLALFLFCVVVAYATVAWTEPLTFELHNDKSLPEVEQEIEEARAGVVAGIEKLDRQLVAAQAAGQVDANVTRRISSERASLVNRQTAMANRLLGFKAVARTLATNKANNEAAISALQSQLSDARQKGSVTQQIDGELAAEQLNKKSIDKSIETLKTDTLSAVEIEQALGRSLS